MLYLCMLQPEQDLHLPSTTVQSSGRFPVYNLLNIACIRSHKKSH